MSALVQPAMATPLSGATEPEFTKAVETWLQDDDTHSLPLLASLASKGNIAARLLLARIEITDRASTEYVRQLSRGQRLDLFRSHRGNGNFRSSWLQLEADNGNLMAQTLLKATSLGINFSAITRLYEINEIESSEHLVRKIAVDGSAVEHQKLSTLLPEDSELVPYLRGFQFSRDGRTTGISALQHMTGMPVTSGTGIQSATRFVDYGYQAGKHAIGDWQNVSYFDAIGNWVLTAREARPVANLCLRNCLKTDLTACAIAAFGLVGGYYEVIRFDSPLENVISQDRFLDSPRAQGMVKRRIANAATEAGVRVFSEAELAQHSQCLANAIGH